MIPRLVIVLGEALLLAWAVNSDQYTDEDRARLRTLIEPEDLSELSDILNALCSAQGREQMKTRGPLAHLEQSEPELTPEERDAQRVARARATHK